MSVLRGWPARGLALLAGLAAGFAHPPFGLLPGLLGYGLVLLLAETEGPKAWRSAFFRGWLAGLGYFAVAVWWITEPFMVDAREQGWMAPFALVLMSAGLALFWAAGTLLYRFLRPTGFARVLVFAACLSGAEWLRGHVLTGFPWDLPGETWRAGSALSQAAALVGAYGLGWITIAIAAAPAILVGSAPRRERLAVIGAAGLALCGLYGFGAARLAQAPPLSQAYSGGGPHLRVVQANIDQKDKWRPENLGLIFDTYVRLSRQPATQQADIIIWPEGALPAVINDLLAPGSPYSEGLLAALQPGQTLFMGANRAEAGSGGEGTNGTVRYFNSLIALRREADGLRVTGIYDKHRLVPFGEYMPAGDLARKVGFRSLVHMADDFTAGPAPRPMSPAGVPALQPMICYEALFPGFTREAARRGRGRPAWILNVSNDAWFGVTSGPWQHFNMAGYRAIEEGLPVVRATPTGVSALIDAYGRSSPERRIGLGGMGVIDAGLPPPAAPTAFCRVGDAVFAVMLLLSAVAAWGRRARRV